MKINKQIYKMLCNFETSSNIKFGSDTNDLGVCLLLFPERTKQL